MPSRAFLQAASHGVSYALRGFGGGSKACYYFAFTNRRSIALPLYEYKCVKCGHRFEKIESVSASETKKCPECGARAARQISSSAIQFKGSGWYATDYATKKPEPASGEKSGDGESPKPQEKPAASEPAAAKPSTEKGTQKKKK